MFKKLYNKIFNKNKFFTITDCGTHFKLTLHKPIVVDTDKPIIIDSDNMFVINSKLLHENPYKGKKIPFNTDTRYVDVVNDLSKKYNKALQIQDHLNNNGQVYNEKFNEETGKEDCLSCKIDIKH